MVNRIKKPVVQSSHPVMTVLTSCVLGSRPVSSFSSDWQEDARVRWTSTEKATPSADARPKQCLSRQPLPRIFWEEEVGEEGAR